MVTAFATAFAGSVMMWWVYFDLGAKRGTEHIEHHEDPGRVARNAYTYLHIPIVAGIILAAVADEMLLAHPTGHLEPLFIWTVIGGPALFLAGTMVFKAVTSGRPWLPFSHLVGLGLFALLAVGAVILHPEPLHLAIAVVAVLLVVAVWEWGSFHGGWLERGVRVPQFIQRRAERLGAVGRKTKGEGIMPHSVMVILGGFALLAVMTFLGKKEERAMNALRFIPMRLALSIVNLVVGMSGGQATACRRNCWS